MCWNCRNNTGRPHVGGKGRLPKAGRERIERQVAADIAEHTKTFPCAICGQPYQEYTKDGEQYDGLCGNCPQKTWTEEEKLAIKKRLAALGIKRAKKWREFEKGSRVS